ncbi:MAG: hypothetical protein AAGD25_18550 [Cyanobacteria bacterium P01_F01_bin.150]
MLEFNGFHPKETTTAITLKLTDSGVSYHNLDNGAFQFIAYKQIAGFSGWNPGYGSLHIYSANPNLMIHVNFPEETADQTLDKIQKHLRQKV